MREVPGSAAVGAIDATAYAETMETLAILEATATSLAAPHLSKKALRTARRLNAAMADSLARFDLVSFDDLNHELHETLYSSARRPPPRSTTTRGRTGCGPRTASLSAITP